jgi:hypothetical protein
MSLVVGKKERGLREGSKTLRDTIWVDKGWTLSHDLKKVWYHV